MQRYAILFLIFASTVFASDSITFTSPSGSLSIIKGAIEAVEQNKDAIIVHTHSLSVELKPEVVPPPLSGTSILFLAIEMCRDDTTRVGPDFSRPLEEVAKIASDEKKDRPIREIYSAILAARQSTISCASTKVTRK